MNTIYQLGEKYEFAPFCRPLLIIFPLTCRSALFLPQRWGGNKQNNIHACNLAGFIF